MSVSTFPGQHELAAERREEMREAIRLHIKHTCGEPYPSTDMANVVLIELIKLVRNDSFRLVEIERRRPVSITEAIAFLRGAGEKILIQYEQKVPPFYPSLTDSTTDFISAITEAGYELIHGNFSVSPPHGRVTSKTD